MKKGFLSRINQAKNRLDQHG